MNTEQSDEGELSDEQIQQKAKTKTERLKQLNSNIMEFTKQKEQISSELQEAKRTLKVITETDESPMVKHIGAGYYVETEHKQVKSELEEKIDRLSEKKKRLNNVIEALNAEMEEISESLEELIEKHSKA